MAPRLMPARVLSFLGRARNRCRRHHGNNQGIGMPTLLLGIFLALLATTPEARANIRNNCFQKWKTDYEMVEYCIEEQSTALSKLRRIPNSGIKSRCSSKWGQDYEMVVYCIEEQSGAAGRLGVTRERTSSPSQPSRSAPTPSRGGCSSFIISNGEKICI